MVLRKWRQSWQQPYQSKLTTADNCSTRACAYSIKEMHTLNKLHRLTQRDSRLAHFCTTLGLGLHLGYLASSGAKSDIIFLIGDPDFLSGQQNFASISLSYRDPHFGLLGVLGVFSYLWCKIWRHILALQPQFLIGETKFRAYLV